jgi:AraC-like DNA-binding protein
MASSPLHHSRVLGSPWPGVYVVDTASGRHFGKHWHATYGLGLLDQGAHRSASGRGAVDAFEGDLLSTNPGEVHDGRPLGGPLRRWRTMYLEPEVIASLQAEAGGHVDVEFTSAAFHDPELQVVVRTLLDRLQAWSNGAACGTADALACEEALVQACGAMLARHATGTAPADASGDALPGVLDRLDDEASPAPTLEELARLAGLGRFQLLRRFRRAYGTTPHAWLLQQRAERARGLIARGLPLAEVAAATGFADQPHLTRVFAQRFGFTPGAWQAVARPQSRSRPAA